MYNPSYQSMLKMSEPPMKTSVNSLQANYRTHYAIFSPETAPLCWCLKATADNFNVLAALNFPTRKRFSDRPTQDWEMTLVKS